MTYNIHKDFWFRGTIYPFLRVPLFSQNNNSFAASTNVCVGLQKMVKPVTRLLGFTYYFMSRWRHWNNIDLFRNVRRNEMPEQKRNAEKDRRPKEPQRERDRKADPQKPREDRPQRREAEQRREGAPARREA